MLTALQRSGVTNLSANMERTLLVLSVVPTSERLPFSVIAEESGFCLKSIHSHIKALRAAGLVETRRKKIGMAYQLVLTPEGYRLVRLWRAKFGGGAFNE
jgi:DNA-binding transcriptional ArsR family regulator